MVLNPSRHDSCLLCGLLTKPYSTAFNSDLQYQTCVRLYVNDFVFNSSDPFQEKLFKTLLQEQIQVKFMVNVDYFLGTAYSWLQHADGNISFHLCQSVFTKFTYHLFSFHTSNKVHNMTPYNSRFQVDSIPPIEPLYPDLPCQRQVYHSIVVCIYWLSTFTCP